MYYKSTLCGCFDLAEKGKVTSKKTNKKPADSGRKSSGKKNSGKAKNNNKNSKGKGKEKPESIRHKRRSPENIKDILLLATVFLTFLFVLSIYTDSIGPVGRAVSNVAELALGRGKYLLPVFMCALVVVHFFTRKEEDSSRLFWLDVGLLIMTASVCGFLHTGSVSAGFGLDLIRSGGGIVGFGLSWIAVKAFSEFGAYLLLSGLMALGILLATEFPFLLFIKGLRNNLLEKEAPEQIEEMHDAASGNGSRTPLEVFADEETAESEEKGESDQKNEASDEIVFERDTVEENILPKEKEQIRTKKKTRTQKTETDTEEEEQIKVLPESESNSYRIPDESLLTGSKRSGSVSSRQNTNEVSAKIEATMESFSVPGKVIRAVNGPTVTRYEVELQSGVKISKITALASDMAYELAVPDVRIIAPIPGKRAVGLEVPNVLRDIVTLKEVIRMQEAKRIKGPLRAALGLELSGKASVVDIKAMPHILLAGATGSGKSSCINSIICSVIMSSTPEQLKMVLIDPKMVELNLFSGIPHLIFPVITNAKMAAAALIWLVNEMERRYRTMAQKGARSIEMYNDMITDSRKEKQEKLPLYEEENDNEEKGFPYILVVIDELADLMMVSPAEVEESIARIAQKARAVGIHLVIATQRPSVDVVTGVIKANIPSRIAFAVPSQMDSRVILDSVGAEKLLGLGDMLFLPSGAIKPVRVQGSYVSNEDITRLVAFIKRQAEPSYHGELDELNPQKKEGSEKDPLTMEALAIVVENGTASVSMLQRRLKLGYARAARIIDQLEQMGMVGPYEGSKPRKVLIGKEEYERMTGMAKMETGRGED